jgi:sulfide:quinone oxidoreductase
MSKIVVLGAGIAGHTTALVLRRGLPKKDHEVIVVSPNSKYQWVPSNIWVGIGQMTRKQVTFDLKKVYNRKGIIYKQAKAISIHPEGNGQITKGFIKATYVDGPQQGKTEEINYDFLVNATGPKLNFEATEGLGPNGHTVSVCSYTHAEEAWEKLQVALGKMEKGEKQRFVIGTGHPNATCQGAAFEYILNVAFEINKRKLHDLAEITLISNEYELGDFGMGGAFVDRGGYITSTKIFTESVLAEYGINWIKRAGVYKVEKNTIHYENLEGEYKTIDFDFAMLIPAFAGAGIKAFNKNDEDITDKIFAPNGFMKVDADYTKKPFEEWNVDDWPSTYQNPDYKNIFAPGIAFAPPHPISKPMTSKNGTGIYPTPPRTGMPSGVMGKIVAKNIINIIKRDDHSLKHRASMGKMGAACVISQGYGVRHGAGSTLTVFPVVPDYEKYPMWGRDISYTIGETGLAGHWIKLFLHVMFIYKAKAKPFWWLIPE